MIDAAAQPFRVTRRAEEQYYRDILTTIRRYFAERGELYGTARLVATPHWLETYAEASAREMLAGQLITNGRGWRAAAQAQLRGREMYAALQEELRGRVGVRYRQLLAENARLITSLPEEISSEVTKQLAGLERQGKRADVGEQLALLSHVSKTKARLIARTETAKAQSALTQARAEDLGLNWYAWRTAQDSDVRPSHRNLNGVIVNFADAPAPEALVHVKSTLGHYQAGNSPNCRCYMEPLIRYAQVSWPHRVYTGGRIRSVTLAVFRRMNMGQMVKAA